VFRHLAPVSLSNQAAFIILLTTTVHSEQENGDLVSFKFQVSKANYINIQCVFAKKIYTNVMA